MSSKVTRIKEPSKMSLSDRIKRYEVAKMEYGSYDERTGKTLPVRYVSNFEGVFMRFGDIILGQYRKGYNLKHAIALAFEYNKYMDLNDVYIQCYLSFIEAKLSSSDALKYINEYLVGRKEVQMTKEDMERKIDIWDDSNLDIDGFVSRDYSAYTVIGTIMDSVKFDTSDITYTDVFTTYKINGKVLSYYPTSANGPRIFDNMYVSEEIPYIRYKSNKDHHKIYSMDMGIDLDRLIGNKNLSTDKIFFMLLLGGPKSNSNSYAKVTIDLVSSTLELNISKSGLQSEEILKRLEKYLTCKLSKLSSGRAKGVFYMYGDITYIREIFLDIIMTDLDGILFMNEVNMSYPDRVRLNMFYRELDKKEPIVVEDNYIRNLSSVSFSITQMVSIGTDDKVESDGSVSRKLKPGHRYIKVDISMAATPEMAEEFKELMSYVFEYYKSQYETLFKLYSSIVPDINEEYILTRRLATRIQRLKSIAPEIFIKGYARMCQGGNRQPELLNKTVLPYVYDVARKAMKLHNSNQYPDREDEDLVRTFDYISQRYNGLKLEELEDPEVVFSENVNRKVKSDNINKSIGLYTGGRKLSKFPKESIKGRKNYRFFCPDAKYKHPTILNNTLENSDVYDKLPCCALSDQSLKTSNSLYREYYEGIKVKKSKKNKPKISSLKTLDVGRFGNLVKEMRDVLKSVSNKYNYFRYGVVRSKNSFVHSLLPLYLSDDDNYSEASFTEKEKMVVDFRLALAKSVNHSVYKQELYDRSGKEIKDMIEDTNSYFDPDLFYRGIEEFLGLNVYVFEYDTQKKEDERSFLSSPRFAKYHSRLFRDRKCIIILKHWGSISDRRVFPQCELVNGNNKTGSVYVFDREFNRNMYKLFLNVNSNVMWGVENGRKVVRKNWYSRVNYLDIAKGAMGQVIDMYGKCRAIIMKTRGGNITMVTPPTQPHDLIEYKNIDLGSITSVRDVFRQRPNSVDIDGDNIVGLWYSCMDVPNAIYFPVVRTQITSEYRGYEIGPSSPINMRVENTTQGTGNMNIEKLGTSIARVNTIRKTIKIFLQLVTWIYLIYLRNGNTLENLIKRLVVLDTKRRHMDSYDLYNGDKLPLTLPDVVSIKSAYEYIDNNSRGFVGKGTNKYTFLMYSKKMREYVIYFLNSQIKKSMGLLVNIPTEIIGVYVSSEDFKKQKNSRLFTNNFQMKMWSRAQSRRKYKKIYTKLDYEKYDGTEKVIYMNHNGDIYTIQNINENMFGSNIGSAMSVANTWKFRGINTGQATPITNLKHPHVLYEISKSGILEIVEDNSESSDVPLELLRYYRYNNTKSYAAMLYMSSG
ncbi:MAG: hypothetical protein COA94_02070 [Rickettsiales bacterium]|nr:MAG: hypothetical protein COA94_02070 [Rickettsiales bacterium]